MRPSQYSTATLIDLFHRHTVASLPEVMAALGTRARRTAFRKLKELSYRTSYSHRGGYYTLEELIDFDQHGLWSFRAVRFSAAGTLPSSASACAAPAAGARPWKKTPEVIAAIEAALQHDVAGDPITGIRWTRRTTEKIATELATLDIQVCPRTVARILKDLDYRLRVNHKRVSAGSGPDRDQQFQYIAEQHAQFAQRGLPIVSIDTKKRELIGNFKNQGTTWERSPQAVNDHDFRSQADGIAIPYGVYDLCANRGFVVLGTSHDTPEFAADNLVRWWQRDGLERYRYASKLLVLADSGGSNAPRIRCFKYALQNRLVDPYQLTVTVCHYPSGASKWNPIDHRLFSEISKNWAGHPLRSYRTILNHIRTTTTDTGLCVTAQLVDQEYPKGVKISDAQFASIALEPHQIQPLRNYTIRPRS